MTDRSARRGPWMIAIGMAALIVVSVAATWIASTRIRSPAEVAARTLAPEPSPILVPVEMRKLSTDVVTRGTGRFGSPQTLRTVPTALKLSTPYVDVVPVAGDHLDEGDVVMVVSGRPVIILVGAQPAFRDMGPGMTGSDILQLEAALDRLGFPPGEIDGRYDLATEFAVAEWYRSHGYTPIMRTAEQLAEIRVIEQELATVERDHVSAADARAVAFAEVLAARETHRAALLAQQSAEDVLLGARTEAAAANAAATGEVASAQGAADIAWRQVPDVYAPEEEQQLALAEWENLRVAVDTAQANADLIRATGEAAIRDAERALAAAPGEVSSAAAALSAAETRFGLAQQAEELVQSPAPALVRDLEVAKERSGVQVPVDEVIFVSEAPVRVADVLVARGDEVTGDLLSVTDTVVAIDGALALDDVGLIETGMAVEVSEPDLGIDTTGVVSAIAAGPGTRGVDGFHVWFETLVNETSTSTGNVVGASVRLTMSIESSGGPVLAVPASALTLSVDGSSSVLVDRGGSLEPVPVEPGLSADGYVGVAAVAGAELAEGELVVVGFEQRGVAGE